MTKRSGAFTNKPASSPDYADTNCSAGAMQGHHHTDEPATELAYHRGHLKTRKGGPGGQSRNRRADTNCSTGATSGQHHTDEPGDGAHISPADTVGVPTRDVSTRAGVKGGRPTSQAKLEDMGKHPKLEPSPPLRANGKEYKVITTRAEWHQSQKVTTTAGQS